MQITQNTYCLPFKASSKTEDNINLLASELGKKVQLPDSSRNYSLYNDPLVEKLVNYGEKAVPAILGVIENSKDKKAVMEGLYVLDRMLDSGVTGLDKTYPVLSKHNNTDSPEIQTLLAGIYRKTLIPDAFGPLLKMLANDINGKTQSPYFDPSEEIGGAVLEYLKSYQAAKAYPKQT